MNIETANRLYELRKQNGLSQEEVADKLGISRQAVSKWERAEASPDTDNLILLARLYNVTLDELLNSERSVEYNLENPTEEVIEDIKDEEYDETHDDEKEYRNGIYKKIYPVKGVFDGCVVFLVVISYLLIGFLSPYGWGCYWVLFLLIPILSSLFDAIATKRMSPFYYPVLVVFIYCFLSLRFDRVEYNLFGNTFVGFWHPLWVLFITIPLYYVIAGGVDAILSKKYKLEPTNRE